MSKNLKVLYEYLCENHPETSNDIFYGLELVQSTIGDSVVQMKKDMHKAVDDGENYDKISEMLKISKLLLSSIDDYLKDLIEMENQFTDENDDEDNSDVADNEKICLLTDDYTYVKVSSVIIGKQKYYVKNFTKALLVICNYLYELSNLFNDYCTSETIITEDETYTNERLNLLLAVKIVINNAFNLIGIIPREEI